MTIVSKEPALMLTSVEYEILEDAYNIIEKIDDTLSEAEWDAVEHRFNYSLRSLMEDLGAILVWADESERG